MTGEKKESPELASNTKSQSNLTGMFQSLLRKNFTSINQVSWKSYRFDYFYKIQRKLLEKKMFAGTR